MEYVVIGILGLMCGSLFVKVIDNKKILELEEENYELQKWKSNHSDAERRAATFARKLKAVEDIVIEDDEKNEFGPITRDKLKKELLITR